MRRWLLTLTWLYYLKAWSAVLVQPSTQFQLNYSNLMRGDILIGAEWLATPSFYQHPLKILDFQGQVLENYQRSQVVLSFEAFITQADYEQLQLAKLNQTHIVEKMFSASSIDKKSQSFSVTTKVSAYGFPVNLRYEVSLKDEKSVTIPSSLKEWFQTKIKSFSLGSRSHYLVVETYNFSQLMFKNTGIILVQELSNGSLLVLATGLSTIDLQKANLFFPFGYAKEKMLSNVREQMVQMAQEIQSL